MALQSIISEEKITARASGETLNPRKSCAWTPRPSEANGFQNPRFKAFYAGTYV